MKKLVDLKLEELEQEAKVELEQEAKELAKSEIKERLKEIHLAKKALTRMEKQYKELLAKTVDDVIEDQL